MTKDDRINRYEVISVRARRVGGMDLEGCFEARYYDDEWRLREVEVVAHDELAAWQISKYIVRKRKPSLVPMLLFGGVMAFLIFAMGVAFGADAVSKPQEVQHEQTNK